MRRTAARRLDATPPHERAQRLTGVARDQSFPNRRPRDAAALIILDADSGAPKMLMGRRSSKHAFLPGAYVFPGGSVHRSDYRAPVEHDLQPEIVEKLMAGMKGRASAGRARALALAAIRETFEEAGILIGRRTETPGPSGEWSEFFSHGVAPSLDGLAFIARAITPPGRPRRFDTRFFAISAAQIILTLDRQDGELEDLRWLTLRQAYDQALQAITRVVLEELDERLAHPGLQNHNALVPYYFMLGGSFQRTLI